MKIINHAIKSLFFMLLLIGTFKTYSAYYRLQFENSTKDTLKFNAFWYRPPASESGRVYWGMSGKNTVSLKPQQSKLLLIQEACLEKVQFIEPVTQEIYAEPSGCASQGVKVVITKDSAGKYNLNLQARSN